MRRVFFVVCFVATLFFAFPIPTHAACQVWVPSQCSKVRCNVSGTWNCCNSSSECTQAGGSPMDNNPSDTNPGDNITCTPSGGSGNSGILTAIGCVPVLGSDNGKAFGEFVLKWAIGIGGGIAFLLILYGGFMVMTSSGNPERLKAGQELLTSAISGLVLLIFSVFVLNFLGINILGIFS
jgi:hypothetical protein